MTNSRFAYKKPFTERSRCAAGCWLLQAMKKKAKRKPLLLNKEVLNAGENLPETGDPSTLYVGLLSNLDVTCLPWINLSFCFCFFSYWPSEMDQRVRAPVTKNNWPSLILWISMVLWPPHRHHGLCILPHTHTYINIIFKTYCVRGHTCYGMCKEVKWQLCGVELLPTLRRFNRLNLGNLPLSPDPSYQSQSSQLQNKTRNDGAHLQSQHSGRPRQESSKVKLAWVI